MQKAIKTIVGPAGLLTVLLGLVSPVSSASQTDIVEVSRERVPVTIAVAGTVVARKAVTLTAQLPGRVAGIAGQEGDRFRAGAVLVTLDDAALVAKLESARAAQTSAAAQVRNAGTQLTRELASPQSNAAKSAPGGMGMPAMFDQMMFNPMQNAMGMQNRGMDRTADVIQRETQLAQARSAQAHSVSQIKEIEEMIRDSKSVAPFTGVIETVFVEVGDTVQPGQRLVSFSDTAGYQVQVDVPARLKRRLKLGAALGVTLDGADHPVSAKLSRIFPVADPKDHTIRIELDLPAGVDTTVGAYAEVAVAVPSATEQGAILIPASAIVRKGGLPLVFVVDEAGVAKLRIVRVGSDDGHGRQVILSGLREGERIVANPRAGLRSGEQVAQVAAEAAASDTKKAGE